MKTDYISILKKFRRHKILVVGDFILDVYLQGNCTRIAPEATVPVVDIVSKKQCLGGAANAAANLSAMGCKVSLCTATGNDAAANNALGLMAEMNISTGLITRADERSTLVKTRVVGPSHTLVRYDEGTDAALDEVTECALIDKLIKGYRECDAVLIADYDKGTITENVILALKDLQLSGQKFIAVDSKRPEMFALLKPLLIKPNYDEAIKMLNLSYSKGDRAEQLKIYGQQLREKTNAALIAVTMDKDGAMFFEDGKFKYRSYAPQVNNPAVSGAGDTFISACLLALVSGCKLPVAADIATVAATIAIKKSDTATCANYELVNVLNAGEKSLLTMSILKKQCLTYKKEGKRIVFTNGCFDILHSGHVNYLRKAREMGDVLIVGLNTDESIRRLKGEERPINSLNNRIEVLSALGCVDHVIPFGEVGDDTPIPAIKVIRPDVFVKGGDYKGKYLAEEKVLKRIGCKIEFVPLVFNQSTTKIIDRIEHRTNMKIAIAN